METRGLNASSHRRSSQPITTGARVDIQERETENHSAVRYRTSWRSKRTRRLRKHRKEALSWTARRITLKNKMSGFFFSTGIVENVVIVGSVTSSHIAQRDLSDQHSRYKRIKRIIANTWEYIRSTYEYMPHVHFDFACHEVFKFDLNASEYDTHAQ